MAADWQRNLENIRMIFFDIDGTLIDMETKEIRDSTIAMLHKLQDNGIRIAICTGRSPMQVPAFGDVKFDAILAYNGSLCFAGSQIIRSVPIPPDEVVRIAANGKAIGRPMVLATDSELIANGSDQDLIDYYAFSKQTIGAPDPDFDERAKNESVYQMMSGGRAEEYDALMAGVEHAEIAAWWDRAVDIIPKGSGKGEGVRAALAHFGLTPAQAAAFGDGDNDLPMLEAVSLPIAMANASDSLKQKAVAICAHVKDDGVSQFARQAGWID